MVRPRLPHGSLRALSAVSIALSALGVVLVLENRRVAGTAQFFDPVMPAIGLAFPPVGSLIASRWPRNRVAWVFAAGVLVAAAFFAEQYAVHALLASPGSLPAGTWAAWLGTWLWIPGYLAQLTLLPLLFPDGRPPSRRWLLLAWLAGGLIASATLSAALASQDVGSPAVRNPVGVSSLPLLSGPLRAVGVLVLSPLCLVGLVLRLRSSTPETRARLRWFTAAACLAVVVPVAGTLAAVLTGGALPLALYQTLGVVTLIGIPSAVTASVLRYRLFGIHLPVDALVSRLLVAAGLTAAGVAIYVAVVRLIETFTSGRGGLAPAVIAVVGVALVAAPARRRLQRAVDGLLYRRRRYDWDLLALLGQRLHSTLGPDEVLPEIVETIAAALRLPYVAVTVGQGEDVTATAVHGEARGDTVTLPLTHHQEHVGTLTVAPRAPGQVFDAADRRLLERLAGQAGVTAYALRLSADLQRSRERLVSAREEERRRLRRDLHDGLKPAIAGVRLGLEAARNLVGPDSTAHGLLDRLRSELDTAGGDLGRLVYDLRPAALEELGLVGALRQQAARFERAPDTPEVLVEAPDQLPGLPAAVEVAAYRIGQEALENVRKHARAHSCVLHLAVEDGHLRLEVRDDGSGLPPPTGDGGIGLTTMRERAAELGGSCSVETLPEGGTRVRATLPLAPR